jgi:hypothetical protein
MRADARDLDGDLDLLGKGSFGDNQVYVWYSQDHLERQSGLDLRESDQVAEEL